MLSEKSIYKCKRLSTIVSRGLYDKKLHENLVEDIKNEIGPGTLLQNRLWFVIMFKCDCVTRKNIMNGLGPIRCAKGIDDIMLLFDDLFVVKFIPLAKSFLRRLIVASIKESDAFYLKYNLYPILNHDD